MADPALAALAARLARLEDLEAIRALIAAYGPLADAGDGARVAALFAPDGIYAIAGFAEARGRAAIAALLETPHHRALMADGCAHLLGPVAICLDGDTATACGHSIVFKSGASGFAAHRVAANRWHLSRRAGQWLVARRDNALLDGNAAARILLSPPAAPHPPQTPPR